MRAAAAAAGATRARRAVLLALALAALAGCARAQTQLLFEDWSAYNTSVLAEVEICAALASGAPLTRARTRSPSPPRRSRAGHDGVGPRGYRGHRRRGADGALGAAVV
jgi:hypothetical protein